MVIIFLLIVAIVLTITLVTESFGIAAIEFAVAMIIFNLWIIPKAYLIWWAFLLGNWPLVLLIFVGYFALGTVWSFYRWFVFLRAKQRQYPGNSRSNYTASNYSDKIVGWIVAWPFSIIAYVLGDFVLNAARWCYEHVSSIYDKIGDAVLGKEKLAE